MADNRDWSSNSKSAQATLGVSPTFAIYHQDREQHDFYATEPKALQLLLELEKFNNVWECACGVDSLSDVLREHGILGKNSDLVVRKDGQEQIDFLEYDGKWGGDIITNPPFKYATDFILKALDIIRDGDKVAMFLPTRYLSGIDRHRRLFGVVPPARVYIASKRLRCAINADFQAMIENKSSGMMDYAWLVWAKGYKGDTTLKWFNTPPVV